MAKAKCVESGIKSDEEADAILKDVKTKLKHYGVSSKYIKQRYAALGASQYASALEGQLTENGSFIEYKLENPLFHDLIKKHSNPKGAHLGERMDLFDKAAGECIEKMYKEVQEPPDDIIHVTCSGYLAPSPVEKLVSKREWLNTTVTHSYHMGCYGSLPGIRMAHGFLSSSFFGITPPKSRIDIVHTETSSIHSDISDDSPESIIVMTLFSDGFIKYSAFTEKEAKKRQLRGLKIIALKENIISDSLKDMTLNPGQYNFHATLSMKIPFIIKDNIRPFVISLLQQIGKDFDREKDNLAYAIHTGGPLIVKSVCKELGLTEKQVELCNKVFYENGNLSSVTIPYIFHEIINSDDIPVGTIVLNLGFGPGLTVSGMVLEKV
jgi:predicted naringenin-chalcone synthase